MENNSRKKAIKRWIKEREAWKKGTDFKEYSIKLNLRKRVKETFHRAFKDIIND